MPLMKYPRHASEQARENEGMVLIWNIFRPVGVDYLSLDLESP